MKCLFSSFAFAYYSETPCIYCKIFPQLKLSSAPIANEKKSALRTGGDGGRDGALEAGDVAQLGAAGQAGGGHPQARAGEGEARRPRDLAAAAAGGQQERAEQRGQRRQVERLGGEHHSSHSYISACGMMYDYLSLPFLTCLYLNGPYYAFAH